MEYRTYRSIFWKYSSRMQIRKKWLYQVKNFFNKHFKEYYLASFCWWISSSCENHCNLMLPLPKKGGGGGAALQALLRPGVQPDCEQRAPGVGPRQPAHQPTHQSPAWLIRPPPFPGTESHRNNKDLGVVKEIFWFLWVNQCCGSVTFCYGSGSADTYFWRTDLDPDHAKQK